MKNKVVTIVAGAVTKEDLPFIQGDVIAVDYGAFFCFEHKIPIELALGDFDSISKAQFEKVTSYAKDTRSFPSQKDESDTELAIQKAKELGYETMIILGVIGTRMDHFYAALTLLKHDSKGGIIIQNKTNRIQRFKQGHYTIEASHRYLSLFAFETSNLTIQDVEYPLTNAVLHPEQTLGLSNQAKGKHVKLSVFSGSVLLIESSDV
jgi:thiamine pyrophosphokinase